MQIIRYVYQIAQYYTTAKHSCVDDNTHRDSAF